MKIGDLIRIRNMFTVHGIYEWEEEKIKGMSHETAIIDASMWAIQEQICYGISWALFLFFLFFLFKSSK